MKKECSTCFHNRRECSVTLGLACQNHDKWTPYTNLEHLQSLSAEEFAEWMNRCRPHGMYGLICEQSDFGCWFDCKHDHYCENENGITTNEIIIKWLNSLVEVNE